MPTLKVIKKPVTQKYVQLLRYNFDKKTGFAHWKHHGKTRKLTAKVETKKCNKNAVFVDVDGTVYAIQEELKKPSTWTVEPCIIDVSKGKCPQLKPHEEVIIEYVYYQKISEASLIAFGIMGGAGILGVMAYVLFQSQQNTKKRSSTTPGKF